MAIDIEKIIKSNSYIMPNLRYMRGHIVEYDISSANISILRQYDAIDDNYYNYLKMLPKIDREIEVGNLCKPINVGALEDGEPKTEPSEYTKILSRGFEEARRSLIISNNIQPEEIVRIAKDAVYVNRFVDLQNTKFGYIEFKKKMIADCVIMLNRSTLVFYWYTDNNINIEVIGLGNNKYLHQNYMITFIGTVITIIERSGVTDALNFISDFYKQYITLSLDLDFYREFNSGSEFRIKDSKFFISGYTDIKNIDISYNANIIRELWSIVVSMYK